MFSAKTSMLFWLRCTYRVSEQKLENVLMLFFSLILYTIRLLFVITGKPPSVYFQNIIAVNQCYLIRWHGEVITEGTEFFSAPFFHLHQSKQPILGAVVVAQLAERSLPTPEIRGSNPDIGNISNIFICQLLSRKDENEEKEAGNGPLKFFFYFGGFKPARLYFNVSVLRHCFLGTQVSLVPCSILN